MRASTSAVYFAAAGREATTHAARRIAALTHRDHAALEGTASFCELVRLVLAGQDPVTAMPKVVEMIRSVAVPGFCGVGGADYG